MKNRIYIVSIIFFIFKTSFSIAQFIQIPINTENGIPDIICLDTTCIVSDNFDKIFISTDLGDSFDEKIVPVYLNENKVSFQYPSYENLYFLIKSSELFFPHRVIKSTNLGDNWETIYDTTGSYFAFEVINDSTYLIGGSQSKIYRTQDYGQQWESLSIVNTGAVYMEFEFYHDTLGIIGRFEAIGRTSDIGDTWDTGYGINNLFPIDIYFANASKVLCTAHGSIGNGKLYKSDDGGYNWARVFNNDDYSLNVIDFVSDDEGYVCGTNYSTGKGIILKTEDGGDTWTEIATEYDTEFYSIEFMNDSLALIGGENGLLLRWNKNESITSTDELSSLQDAIHIYPNPVQKGQPLILDIQNPVQVEQVVVYDALGRAVKEFGEAFLDFPLQVDLTKGLFFISVQLKNGQQVNQKVVSF